MRFLRQIQRGAVAAAFCLICTAPGFALIDLEMRPSQQVATVGSVVKVELWAVSDSQSNQSIGAMDVILLWDPTKLSLTGFTNTGAGYSWFQSGWLHSGGLNSSHADGDAMWTAFAAPGNPAQATPAGLKVTTFTFLALEETPVSVIAIPLEWQGFQTIVFSGDAPNTNVTGQLWGGSVEIVSDLFVPTSFVVFRGTHLSGDIGSLYFSDDNRLIMRPGPTLSVQEDPIQLILHSTAPAETITELKFTLEAHANVTNISQRLDLFNFVTGMYEEVDARAATTSDSVVEVTITTNPSRFVQPGTRALQARVRYRQVAPVFLFPWEARIDQTVWRIKT